MDSGLPTALFPRPSRRERDRIEQSRHLETEQLLLYALGQAPGSVVLESQLRGALLALEEMLMLLAGSSTLDVQQKVCDSARQLRIYLQAVDTAIGGGALQSLFARYAVMHLIARTLNVPWPESALPQAQAPTEGGN